MSDEREIVLERFRSMRLELTQVIDGLKPPHLTEHTLDGWSIKDHLYHIASWDYVRALEVIRISAGHTLAWRMNGEQDEAFNMLVYDLHKDLGLEQAFWELTTSRECLLKAIEGATQRGLDPTLYGEAGLLSSHEAQHTGWIRRWREEKGY